MSIHTNKALAERFVDEVFNEGNLEAVDEFVAPMFVHNSPPPSNTGNRDGLKQMVAWIRSTFPDCHHTVLDTLADGDKVVQRWVNRGTHNGEFLGVSATGRQVEIQGITIYRIAGGTITEMWDEIDLAGVMQQLGAVPAAEGT